MFRASGAIASASRKSTLSSIAAGRNNFYSQRRVAPITNGIRERMETGNMRRALANGNNSMAQRSSTDMDPGQRSLWSLLCGICRKSDDAKRSRPVTLGSLSSAQRTRVITCWNRIPNKRLFGEEVYIQIFMHKPVLKSLFPFRAVPVQELKNNSLFTRQAGVFADFLDSIVYYLSANNETLISDMCTRVGISHAMMTKVNFDPEWWKLFADSVLDRLDPFLRANLPWPPFGSRLRLKRRLAWQHLMHYVVEVMSEGFRKQRQRDLEEEKAKGVDSDGCSAISSEVLE